MSTPVEVTTSKVIPDSSYSASSIILYGIPLLGLNASTGPNRTPSYVTMLVTAPNQLLQFALIYGYAFQGHCYTLPEPVAVAVDQTGNVPARGCGFEPGDGYRMWEVEMTDRTILLQIVNDSFEEVILKRGMAGPKPPLSYHSVMQMAHRGGKLVD